MHSLLTSGMQNHFKRRHPGLLEGDRPQAGVGVFRRKAPSASPVVSHPLATTSRAVPECSAVGQGLQASLTEIFAEGALREVS